MSGKRFNFKTMGQKDFVAYLDDRDIPYTKSNTSTILGLGVTKIEPNHFRLGHRVFETQTGDQLDPDIELKKVVTKAETTNPLSKKHLIKIIDERVQNMGTKGVYHPKRLKPKWNSLTDDKDRLALFEKYITSKESSIGFIKLIDVNLCNKTLEAIIIEHPTCIEYLKSNGVKAICIDKFSKYANGRQYLIEKNVQPST